MLMGVLEERLRLALFRLLAGDRAVLQARQALQAVAVVEGGVIPIVMLQAVAVECSQGRWGLIVQNSRDRELLVVPEMHAIQWAGQVFMVSVEVEVEVEVDYPQHLMGRDRQAGDQIREVPEGRPQQIPEAVVEQAATTMWAVQVVPGFAALFGMSKD